MGNILHSRYELHVRISKLLDAQENAGDQIVIGFSFASDWLRKWREFSGPITERVKQIQLLFQSTCSWP